MSHHATFERTKHCRRLLREPSYRETVNGGPRRPRLTPPPLVPRIPRGRRRVPTARKAHFEDSRPYLGGCDGRTDTLS
ncbi:hypothetical protein EVAR_47671_1 [Eumeta japonica]|uniref:Uncharacterized protein n=1 Tax=Eumeta variegata TaxID=151549 RepID=A0A4C1Y2Q1_EUMVA|nr:hypothetical protein EVAR_47671_1 [Eumeta japonica]